MVAGSQGPMFTFETAENLHAKFAGRETAESSPPLSEGSGCRHSLIAKRFPLVWVHTIE